MNKYYINHKVVNVSVIFDEFRSWQQSNQEKNA